MSQLQMIVLGSNLESVNLNRLIRNSFKFMHLKNIRISNHSKEKFHLRVCKVDIINISKRERNLWKK